MKKLLALLLLGACCAAYAADVDVVAPSDLTKKPQPSKTVVPTGYPKGKEGLVVVEIIIGKDGKVIDAKIKKSTDVDFEPSALEAIKQWMFLPGEKDGAPVATRVAVPFRFNNE